SFIIITNNKNFFFSKTHNPFSFLPQFPLAFGILHRSIISNFKTIFEMSAAKFLNPSLYRAKNSSLGTLIPRLQKIIKKNKLKFNLATLENHFLMGVKNNQFNRVACLKTSV